MEVKRKPLDLKKLNDWTANPDSAKKLEEAKHRHLVASMKKSLDKIEREAKVFEIEEDEEEVTVAVQKGLPSDNDLDAMRGLYEQIDELQGKLDAANLKRDFYLGALESQDEKIKLLENDLSKYRFMSFWERLKFLFTG